MKKNYTLLDTFFSRKKLEILSIGIVLGITGLAIFSYAGGAAGRGQAVTGAPFNNNQTCAKCHSGTADFGGLIFTRLYKADSTQVTSYTPNKQYFFVIVLKHNALAVSHGFQTTCATTTGSTNINTWNNLPVNVANRIVSARNYVEHTTPLTNDTIIIPWKAPAAGTGAVTFYTASNLANGNGRSSGDQVVKSTLNIAEGTAVNGVADEATTVSTAAKAPYSMKVYTLSGTNRILFYNAGPEQKVRITYTDISGNILKSTSAVVSPGNNVWPLYSFAANKIVVINAVTEDNIKTSLKLGINQ